MDALRRLTVLFQLVRCGGLGGVTFDEVDTAAAVPAPATWGMMTLGSGIVGAGMRWRSAVALTA